MPNGSEPTTGFLSSSFSWGGLEMNLIRMAKALQNAGTSVIMYLPKGSPAWKEAERQGLPMVPVPRHRKYYDYTAAWQLSRSLLKEKTEILLFRDNYDMSLCATARFILGNRLRTVYFQGMQLGVPKKNIFHRLRYAYIDAWVSPLEWLREQAIAMATIAAKKVRVIPLGTDIDVQEDPSLRQSRRSELGIPGNQLCAGIIGRLDRAKGQDVAIRAIASLRDKGRAMHLIIQGEATRGEGDHYARELKELVSANNLDGFVHFLPFNPEQAGFYNSIDIAIIASKNETFGMVTVEAMAWGKAIVGTNSAGTPELLGKGSCGLLFQPGNAEELALCLIRLSDEPGLRQLLATAAKRRARDFSLSRMTEGLKLLFREIRAH